MVDSIPNDATLVDLAERDLVSHVLQQNWLERTGYDPIKLARESTEYDRWTQGGYATSAVLVIFCLITLAITLFALKKNMRFLSNNMGVLTVALLVSSLAVFMFFGFNWPGKSKRPQGEFMRGSSFYFAQCYSGLLEWSMLSPERVKGMSKAELEALAKRILVQKAKEVLVFQDKNASVPQEHWLTQKKKLIGEFEWHYRVLSDLSIAGGPYAGLYDLARKELMASPE
jgi:hypothetical protein